MAETHTYNPKLITFIFGGVEIHGFADDTFVEIEQLGDGITARSGADGEIGRAVSNNNLHQVTLTLMQTSGSNDVLSTAYQLDRRTCGGAMVPLMVKDLCGRTFFAASEAWVTKMPNSPFGTTVGNRQWVIQTGEPTYFIGGNQ